MKPHKLLRDVLRGALNQRTAAMRNGRNGRKDYDGIRAAIGRAEVFLKGYPYANDAKVREWCAGHVEDLARIVPANAPKTMAVLLMDKLEHAQ